MILGDIICGDGGDKCDLKFYFYQCVIGYRCITMISCHGITMHITR